MQSERYFILVVLVIGYLHLFLRPTANLEIQNHGTHGRELATPVLYLGTSEAEGRWCRHTEYIESFEEAGKKGFPPRYLGRKKKETWVPCK